MSNSLQEDLKMDKPFRNVYLEAILQLMRTADMLGTKMSAFFKSFGTTEQQFNVLRILRGAGKSGLPTLSISQRMVTHSPDISRLIDRLIKCGMVERGMRSDTDRRIVMICITQKGLTLLESIDLPIIAHNKKLMSSLSEDECKQLSRLLEKLRK